MVELRWRWGLLLSLIWFVKLVRRFGSHEALVELYRNNETHIALAVMAARSGGQLSCCSCGRGRDWIRLTS
ncbi:hypothetical protein LR48_Vigan08g080500 [Vigna angularis]|uniref:Uncharacterized protein n=1 Tax=Phaseolus angularis TaxID=3914 RepID=A0A0L9V4U3_PHAAN|nr:hypothetical protein LR48_Vigan08g080500 [Vigna angularis]